MGKAPNQIDKMVGLRVRQIRQGLGLSMSAVGRKAGVSSQQMQKYEVGINRMSASTVYSICEALDTTFYELFDFTKLEGNDE